METSKRVGKAIGFGDAAVEGLLNGIFAGAVMAALVLAIQVLGGVAPLTALGYFDAGGNASPLVGLFTHVAVSGIYGVIFSLLMLMVGRMFGARMNFEMGLAFGIVYGALIFAMAEWIILPRTNSPLREMPVWAFGTAHLVYGIVLAWLSARNH
jgi:uncharacterized membrane protein YagU involved in acid resistance